MNENPPPTDDAGEARRREVAADRLIEEIYKTLILNKPKLAASPNYGKIVYRRTSSGRPDVQFSTKLENPDS